MAVTKENIAALLEFAPAVTAPSAAAKVSWSNDEQLLRFIGALNRTEFVYPFDYISWLKETNIDLTSVDVLNHADLETLQKIMVSHVRMERFSGGHMQQLLDSGYLAAFFSALKRFA